MTENNLYAFNQVSQCNIAPENLEISRAKITMYTKHFRQKINATVCRVKYQSEQWHCGSGDNSCMDAHHTGGITIDLTVTASQCRTLGKGDSITLKDETLEFTKGVKTTIVKQKDFDNDGADLSDKYRNECDSCGWVSRKKFEGHIQDVVFKVRTKDGKVMNRNGLHLRALWKNLDAILPHSTLMHTYGTPLTIACWLFIGKKILTSSNREKRIFILSVDETTSVGICSR